MSLDNVEIISLQSKFIKNLVTIQKSIYVHFAKFVNLPPIQSTNFIFAKKNRQTDSIGLAVVGLMVEGGESGSATIQTGGLAGSSDGAGDCWGQIQAFHGRHGNKENLVCQRNE